MLFAGVGAALIRVVQQPGVWAPALHRLVELLVLAEQAFEPHVEITLGGDQIDLMSPFYISRPGTIYGGSNEIQRNVIAKHLLGV